MFQIYIEINFKLNIIKRFNNRTKSFILIVKITGVYVYTSINFFLSTITIRDKYFIPLVSKILNRLKGTKVYTEINFKNVYNLIRVKKNEWKTIFRTRYELFEYYIFFSG